jgi:hypothetical protein
VLIIGTYGIACLLLFVFTTLLLQVDWDELVHKLDKMEYDCKASWDHLRAILKHDGSSTDLKGK